MIGGLRCPWHSILRGLKTELPPAGVENRSGWGTVTNCLGMNRQPPKS